MALRLLKREPAEVSTFATARERFEAVTARRRELREKLAGAQAALALATNPPTDGEYASPVIAERASAYLAGRPAIVDRLRAEVARYEHELADIAAEAAEAAAEWREALAAETSRIAAELRPKHIAAVARIARAVEALSAAVEGERSLRAGLGDLGGGMVDAGAEFGSLADFHSVLAVWNRRMLAAGLLP